MKKIFYDNNSHWITTSTLIFEDYGERTLYFYIDFIDGRVKELEMLDDNEGMLELGNKLMERHKSMVSDGLIITDADREKKLEKAMNRIFHAISEDGYVSYKEYEELFPEQILFLPSKEELMSWSEVIYPLMDSQGIVREKGHTNMDAMREAGLQYEVYDNEEKLLEKRFSKWLEGRDIVLVADEN